MGWAESAVCSCLAGFGRGVRIVFPLRSLPPLPMPKMAAALERTWRPVREAPKEPRRCLPLLALEGRSSRSPAAAATMLACSAELMRPRASLPGVRTRSIRHTLEG